MKRKIYKRRLQFLFQERRLWYVRYHGNSYRATNGDKRAASFAEYEQEQWERVSDMIRRTLNS